MNFTSKGFLAAALVLTSACGGSATQNTLFFGAVDDTASGSGLAFADGTLFEDIGTATANVTLVRYVNVEGETTAVLESVPMTVEFVPGMGGADDSFILTINGEAVAFPDGEDGVDAAGNNYNFFSSFSRDFVTTFGLYSYVYDDMSPESGLLNTEGQFAVGFETLPSAVMARMDSGNYSGEFEGYGVLLNDMGEVVEDEAFVNGTIMLTADFAGSMVSAEVDGNVESGDTFLASMAPVGITGNGFVGGLSVTCDTYTDCSSNSELSGVFFGENAEETGGVMSLNLTGTDPDSMETGTFLGGAGFVAGE